jgi:hypothetical protein
MLETVQKACEMQPAVTVYLLCLCFEAARISMEVMVSPHGHLSYRGCVR